MVAAAIHAATMHGDGVYARRRATSQALKREKAPLSRIARRRHIIATAMSLTIARRHADRRRAPPPKIYRRMPHALAIDMSQIIDTARDGARTTDIGFLPRKSAAEEDTRLAQDISRTPVDDVGLAASVIDINFYFYAAASFYQGDVHIRFRRYALIFLRHRQRAAQSRRRRRRAISVKRLAWLRR